MSNLLLERLGLNIDVPQGFNQRSIMYSLRRHGVYRAIITEVDILHISIAVAEPSKRSGRIHRWVYNMCPADMKVDVVTLDKPLRFKKYHYKINA